MVAAIILALLPLLAPPARAATTDLQVTLSLDWFERFEVPDFGIDEEGEFYPVVQIGSGANQFGRVVSDDRFVPSEIPNPWVFTAQHSLPEGVTTIPVVIRINDSDGDLNFDFDRMDVSPANQDVELNLEYDVLTQRWSGDGVPPGTPCFDHDGFAHGQTCAIGDGDPNFPETNDGKRAEVGFSITTSGLPDIDGDGIPDLVELRGIRDSNNNLVADLAALGADPCRKTIVAQIDYMTGAADGHTHRPKDAAIALAKSTYDAAPVAAITPCPYSGSHKATGIDFVTVPGTAVTEQARLSLNSNAYRATRTANFPAALASYAHYVLFAHDFPEALGSSGQCCEPNRGNNKDVIVTLGSWRVMCVADFGTDFGGDDTLQTRASGDDVTSGLFITVGPDRTCNTTSAHATDRQVLTVGTGADDAEVGTVQDQAGTLIHELGHALNLDHGGAIGAPQWKPNYISAMNYWFQTGIPNGPPPLLVNQFRDWKVGNTRLGFSSGNLPPLDEGRLVESAGIGDGTDFTFWWTPNPDPAKSQRLIHSGPGNTALNWNDNVDAAGAPIIDAATVPLDINADSIRTTLTDFDDWSALKFRAQASPDAGGTAVSGWGVGANLGPELDFMTALTQEIAFFNGYDPDLAVTKTVDKADAQAGDTLAYSVGVANVGTGPATGIGVTDTLPDATTQTRSSGYLDAGSSLTETFSYVAPCTTPDGTVLTNTASATGTDAAGGAEANTSNNTASATTTVHAPRLTLAKTATAAVNAGEAVTTDFVVTNTGSGGASVVTLADTLPVDMYYSQALDRGTGPSPTSVVRNPSGTTTVTWSLGPIDPGGTARVQFTTRPSLLFVGGTSLTDTATLTYSNVNGCVYTPVTATAATAITQVPPTRDPLSQGFWKTHPEMQTEELLARVQATDQRFDGSAGTAADGALSVAESVAVLSAGGAQPGQLRAQLLAVLLDLASRRINAATAINSPLSRRLGTGTVGAAVRYSFATLAMPLNQTTAGRYADATTLLDQIANNKSEVY